MIDRQRSGGPTPGSGVSTIPGRRRRARARVPAWKGALRAAAAVAAAVGASVGASGVTYALWSDSVVTGGFSVVSGSTSLTVNGETQHTVAGLDVSRLAPGQSAVAALTLANVGTTPLSASVAGITVLGSSNGLQDAVTVRLTRSTTCSAGLTGGVSARPAQFSTTASPYAIPPGGTVRLCLEVQLDANAPATAQRGTLTFRLDLAGSQVRA